MKPVSILVRRRAALGDVVMTTGIVRELHRQHAGNCVIDIATEFPDVYRNNPYVRSICTMAANAADYDVHYNLDDAYETNPHRHFVDAYFDRVFGADTAIDKSTELFTTAEEESRVDQDLTDYIGDKFIAVHMRNWHWANKNISLDVWFKVMELVFSKRTDYKFVCVGGETDFGIADHPLIFNACGRYNPRETRYLLDHAAVFVGIDSAPFQIAGSSQVPILGLLSHMNPQSILPYRKGIKGHDCDVITANVPCIGCYERQAVPVRRIVCEMNDYPCNRDWNTDLIADKILGHLHD